MPTSIEFLFDFGSPNAYLCHKVLPALAQRTGATIQYVPVLLGGLFKLSNNRSPVETTADIPLKRAYNFLEIERFIKKHGLTKFKMNPFFPVNTLAIMRGAVAAEAQSCLAPYVDAVYVAMWEDARNMGDLAEIAAVLNAAGLPTQALLEGAQQADIKAKLMANTQGAFERGAFGSPMFFVGSEMYFGKDRLADVEEEIRRQVGK